MYVLKNACKNLGRNKGRNILLGVIIFALILSTTVALIIHSASNRVIAEYKGQFGSKVTLGVDFDKLLEGVKPDADGSFLVPTAPEISSEKYLAFSQSEYLKSYRMSMEAGVRLSKLKAVDGRDDDSTQLGNPNAKVLGYSDPNNMPGFVDGTRKITEGNMYQAQNDCLVSSDFAMLNSLKIGDTFQVTDSGSKKVLTLKVSGIYADASKPYGDLPEGVMMFDGEDYANRRNEILVSSDTLSNGLPTSSLTANAEYELKSPDLVDEFEKELRAKGLDDVYTVQAETTNYQKAVAPLEGISRISLIFMWVVLAVGGVILLFITTMAIRERKYEIGVLRAMGMKKGKVAWMVVFEVLIITILCLGIGIGAGRLIAPPIAETLVTSQTQDQSNQVEPQNGISLGGSIEQESEAVVPNLSVSITPQTILQVSLVALTLAILSSAAGVIFITRYEPMRILSERN